MTAEWLTLSEAATVLGLTRNYAWTVVVRERLRRRLTRGRVAIRAADVVRLRARRAQDPPNARGGRKTIIQQMQRRISGAVAPGLAESRPGQSPGAPSTGRRRRLVSDSASASTPLIPPFRSTWSKRRAVARGAVYPLVNYGDA